MEAVRESSFLSVDDIAHNAGEQAMDPTRVNSGGATPSQPLRTKKLGLLLRADILAKQATFFGRLNL